MLRIYLQKKDWTKCFVRFDGFWNQRGKLLACMWSLNRTLISVPNTLLFFFLLYIFVIVYCFWKEKLTWDLKVNSALLSALEKIYFVVCGNLYRNFCLLCFFNLLSYFILQTFCFLHVVFMSAVHCTKSILFICFFFFTMTITFLLGVTIPFALFKKIKSDCAICCVHRRQSALYCW